MTNQLSVYLPDDYHLEQTFISNKAVQFTVMLSDVDIDKQAMEKSIEDELEASGSDDYYVQSTYAISEDIDNDAQELDSDLVLLIVFVGLTIIAILAYIHSKWIYVNDYFRIGSLFTAQVYIMDAVSDVFLAMSISDDILLILAITFIVLPVAITLYQLHHAINKWKRNDELSQWISDNVKILYILSVITGGAFAGISVCTSYAFSLTQTSFPLGKSQLLQFETKKMYSTVLLENIPQLGLQIYLLMQNSTSNEIVYISMAASIMSIIISVLSMISQRSVIRSRDYVSVEFDVKGAVIVSNINQCKNLKSKLQLQMSSLVGIEQELVEIVKPEQIKHGLRIMINFHINNTRAIDLSIETDIDKAQSTGEIANIMKESWNLSSSPTIENVKCSRHESKDRRDNTKVIKIKSVSMNSAKSDEQNEIQMNAEIAMSEFNTNDNVSELPPRISQPVNVTSGGNETMGGIMDEDSDSDDYHGQNVTSGSAFSNEAEIKYSMNSDGHQEMIDPNDGEIIYAINQTHPANNEVEAIDNDIINAVNDTTI